MAVLDWHNGVRSTLRDVISYLWVVQLGNTSYWRPEQSNEIFMLDLDDLLGEDEERLKLADPAIHPVRKISFILSDLKHFHLKQKNVDGALEAELERLRLLHGQFSKPQSRSMIRKHLREQISDHEAAYGW